MQSVSNPNPDPHYPTCKGLSEVLKKDSQGKFYCPQDKINICSDLVNMTITMEQLRSLQDDKAKQPFVKCAIGNTTVK